jgi:hypothetical protein
MTGLQTFRLHGSLIDSGDLLVRPLGYQSTKPVLSGMRTIRRKGNREMELGGRGEQSANRRSDSEMAFWETANLTTLHRQANPRTAAEWDVISKWGAFSQGSGPQCGTSTTGTRRLQGSPGKGRKRVRNYSVYSIKDGSEDGPQRIIEFHSQASTRFVFSIDL